MFAIDDLSEAKGKGTSRSAPLDDEATLAGWLALHSNSCSLNLPLPRIHCQPQKSDQVQ